MSRLCRKCGKRIPFSIIINDKIRNLQNRKFCLDCSPWGKHNNSRIEPFSKRPDSYKNYSEERKEQMVLSLYKRGLERKRYLIIKSGGKCKNCGYNKNYRSLSFHHRNPSEKKFQLNLNNLWSKSLDVIMEEFKKCDLLCMNCHMELEGTNKGYTARVNAKYGTNF